MPMSQFPQQVKKFALQAYRRPPQVEDLREKYVPFTGSPQKHPYDPDKVVLVADPYSPNTFYYEFRTEDVAFVEETATIVDMDGDSVPMARIWVKKGTVGIQCTPFLVADTWKK